MIHQLDLYGRDKVDKAIMRLQAYEPPEGYYLCFSGGKDSCVIKALADMAGVKYDAHYSVASVDPPELVHFIKEYHPDVKFEIPKDKEGKPISMWSLIAHNTMPPTRIVRYCCQHLKENGGKGRLKVTGVRWEESVRRRKSHSEVTFPDKKAKRTLAKELSEQDFSSTPQGGAVLRMDNRENARIVEMCYKNHTTLINPIIDWTTEDVWEFIKEYEVPYCSLYDEGFKRLGCIGCPMGSKAQRLKEFERWPKYYNLYMIAFEKMIENRGGWQSLPNSRRSDDRSYQWTVVPDRETRPDFTDPRAIMDWWIFDT
jgi:phosphoadenosine phosphosulfate reductase